MTATLSTVSALILYLAAAALLWRRLVTHELPHPRWWALALGGAAAVAQALALSQGIFHFDGLDLSFANVASLSAWFVTLLLITTAINKPVENLGILVFPIAGLSALLTYIVPTRHTVDTHALGMDIHILLSILAYSLLGMAACQALLLSVQERHLHQRKPGGFIRALPPMETMEGLLYQLLAFGFALQTLAMLSGALYLTNWFAQHMVHKTVLSILAWCLFATLLWGHWRYGWRGRTAVRWTVGGFVALMMAYFGSKYVLEVLLGR
ncbi:MAG: cytochrome c biogenesis protein CcsA [Gammaproteobacteria bacterium]|nr:cytochrome c biogenesis protein CcsA [Gammaproteobacteria bacterium]